MPFDSNFEDLKYFQMMEHSITVISFFLVAIRKIAKNEAVSLLCYLLLLFSPAMFDDHIAQKIYRMALIPPLVIIIVSSYLVLYVERKRGIKKNLGWVIGASLGYAAFYIIREDNPVITSMETLYDIVFNASDLMKAEIELLQEDEYNATDFSEQIARIKAYAAVLKGEAAPAAAPAAVIDSVISRYSGEASVSPFLCPMEERHVYPY